MQTIKLRQLIEYNACDKGVARFTKHLGIDDIDGTDDLSTLPDEVLDADRVLVNYLSAETLNDVIWVVRRLPDRRNIAFKFARECAAATNTAVTKAADAADAADAAAHAAKAAAHATTIAAKAAKAAAKAAKAAKAATAITAATAIATAAIATATAAKTAAKTAKTAATTAAKAATAAERQAQCERLRALLSA